MRRIPQAMDNDESAPLLESGKKAEQRTYSYRREVLSLAGLSVPIALSFALPNAVQTASVFVVGRSGDSDEMAGVAYGYMFASATGTMVAAGGATALDTLCSQASYVSAATGRPDMIGHYVHRALLVLGLIFVVVVSPVWWFAESLFLRLGQEAVLSHYTCLFLRFYLPGGLFQLWAECIKRFLQIQGYSTACTLNILAATVAAIAANYILVLRLGMGVRGAAIANSIYELAILLSLCAFTWLTPAARKAFGQITGQAFRRWWEFTALALTGIAQTATEWWSFEILALLAGRLDRDSIAAHSILMTSDTLFTTVALGLGVATSIQVGKKIGEGDPSGARFTARAPYIIAAMVGSVECVALYLSRHVYGYIFSDSRAVVAVTAHIIPLMAIFQFSDIANGGTVGILRGVGKNHLAGLCNMFGFYGVGLPMAWFLCFQRGLGVYGLWLGIICGSALLFLLQSSFVVFMNWQKEVDRCRKRLEGTAGSL